MLGKLLELLRLMAANTAFSTFMLGLLPTLLKIGALIQKEILRGQAIERLQHDIDAQVNAIVQRAADAAGNVSDDMDAIASDPLNRERQSGPG